MRKYRVIKQEELEILANRISTSIVKEIGRLGTVVAVPESQSSPFGIDEEKPKKRKYKKRMGGKSLADWIYEAIHLDKFSTKDAVEAVQTAFPEWKTPRPLDSVRVAMNNDPARFEKIGEGQYSKK